MTYSQAVDKANRASHHSGLIRFVVLEAGEYHVATEYDLETWFVGISDNNIVYCTADSE